jgi:group I intron endonuclease
MKGVIYCYHCISTGKKYIGKTLYERKRKEHHCHMVRSGSKRKFYNAVRKYGWKNFIYGIIEECDECLLSQKEVTYIREYDSFKCGYNSTLGGDGKSGWKHTKETKEKISKSNFGKLCSEETKKKLSEVNRGKMPWIFGKKHTLETREKIRLSHLGKSLGEHHNNHKNSKWWNNGQINKRSVECPGNEWKSGRLKLKPYNRRK